MTINDPEVVAELRALYPLYEQALMTNDVEKLVEMFWAGKEVMRFGVSENLYGPQELEAFRQSLPRTAVALGNGTAHGLTFLYPQRVMTA